MQLALALGMTADRLEREMTHRELRQWVRYAREHAMPFRRLEFYMAQIALWVSRVATGNENGTVDDFMIDFGPVRNDDAPPDVDAAKAAFGFAPRKRKDVAA